MKILFYNHTDLVSGAERVLLLILARLDPAFQTMVMCPTGALQQLVEEQKISCLEVKKLEARFTWRLDLVARYLISFWKVMCNVRAEVKTISPDLIHANSIRAGLVMTLATIGLRIPIVWHLHDLLPHHPISTAIRFFVLLASSRIRLLAVSQATADRFRGILLHPFKYQIPIKIILNCADTNKFQPDEKNRSAIRSQLGISLDAPVIGIIGQITERKGQLGLLSAFKCVVQKIPAAILLIVGEPQFNASDEKYFEILQQTTQKLGIAKEVQFLGARRDVPAVMQSLDVLVVNSLAEPCGLVVLEGMASGLPVIGTAVGGTAEMISHAVSGWLVQSQNEQDLVQALVQLIQNPVRGQQLGINARLRVLEKFTTNIYLNAVKTFYRECHLREVGNERERSEIPGQPKTIEANK